MPVHHVGGHYSTDLGTKFADDPVLGIVENLGLSGGLTNILRYYVGVLAAVILLIATNAGLIGVSRLTFSMGHYRQLPERLRQVHPRYRTPYVAILVFSGIAIITLIPGETKLLATLYSFGAMLSFTIAHISVIRLRQRYPDKEREWKPPGSVRALRLRRPADRGLRRLRHLRRLDRGDGAQPAHPGHRRDLDAARDHDLPALPPLAGALSLPDPQGGAARAARRRGGRVQERSGRLRGRRALLRADHGHRGQAGIQATPRDPRDLRGHRAQPPAARRALGRAGGGGRSRRSSRRS